MRIFCLRLFRSGYSQRLGGDPSSGHGGTPARPFHGCAFGAGSTHSGVSIAMHLPAGAEGIGGTMFAIGAVAIAYLLLWLRNARLLAGVRSYRS